MTALFETYDDEGNLQLTTEAVGLYVSSAYSMSTTSMGGGGYGQAVISMPNTTDFLALRCTNGYNISGYRGLNECRIITQTPVCTLDIKILSLYTGLSPSVDSAGLQLFNPSGQLQFSSGQGLSFFLGKLSLYGEDGIGDVGDFLTFPAGTNPYAVIAGSNVVGYTGAQEQDAFRRIINIAYMDSTTIQLASVTENDWPSLPGGGTGSGTYTILAVT